MTNNTLKALAGSFLALGLTASVVHGAGMPNGADIDSAKAKSRQLLDNQRLKKAIEEQRRQSAEIMQKFAPGYKGLDKPYFTAQLPRLDIKGGTGIDVAEIAKKYYSGMKQDEGTGHDLLIFVTLSMPKASLNRLIDQAAQTGAVLVLRGLKHNSMPETVKTVLALNGKRRVGWQINPPAFTRYAVTQAPTFVIANATAGEKPADASGCAPAGEFVSVPGDVSLDYALEVIEKQSPEFGKVAAEYLHKMRKG